LRFVYFLFGADPQRVEGIEVTPEGSSSMSIGELWPDIDKLDDINHRGLFAVDIPEVVPHEERSRASVVKIDKHVRRKGKGALLNDGAGPSNIIPKGREKGSVKRKAVQILSGAPRALSPCMPSRLSIRNIHLRPVWV
jgi:hypothetical protein